MAIFRTLPALQFLFSGLFDIHLACLLASSPLLSSFVLITFETFVVIKQLKLQLQLLLSNKIVGLAQRVVLKTLEVLVLVELAPLEEQL